MISPGVAAATVPASRDIIDLVDPTLEQIQVVVRDLQELMRNDPSYPSQRIKVVFGEPTTVMVNRNRRKVLKEMFVRFFEASGSGELCYSFYRRSGYRVSGINYGNIRRLSISPGPGVMKGGIETVRALGRSIHPNAWEDLRRKIETSPGDYIHLGLARISILRKFPSSVIEAIKRAFDTKTEYRYDRPGTKRDLSVSMKVCADGIFRAWFSSEYPGCANGSYYLLINPTTASFREDD